MIFKIKNVVSLWIASILMFRFFYLIANVCFSESIYNLIVHALVIGISVFVCILQTLGNRSLVNISSVMGVTFILIVYAFYYIVDTVELSFFGLIIYVIIPILAVNEEYDVEKILRYTIYMSICSVPFIDVLLEYRYQALQQIDMARAYALFVGIVACFLHFVFYRDKANCILILGYVYNIYVLTRLIFVANRGIYFSIIVMLISMQIIYMHEKEIPDRKRKFWKRLFVIEILFGIFIVLYFNDIIIFLYDAISKNGGTMPSFLIKMRKQIRVGDISNGRNPVYGFFVQKIFDNPFGYGMKSARRVSEGLFAYPHNFLLQLWFEFGLIVGTVLNIIVCAPIYKLFTDRGLEYNKKIWLLFIVIITVPKLLVSGDIWAQPQFWLMFGIGLNIFYNSQKKKQMKEKKNEI